MKNCTDCRHAEWYKTEKGRLSPTGDGSCRYPYKASPLPESMHWVGGREPRPLRVTINRREELKNDCVYFERTK
jgi:hypothetical protein